MSIHLKIKIAASKPLRKPVIKPGYFFRHMTFHKFRAICLAKDDSEGWIMAALPHSHYVLEKDPFSDCVSHVSKREYEEVVNTEEYPWSLSEKYYKFSYEHPLYYNPIKKEDLFGSQGERLYLDYGDKPLADQSLSGIPRKGIEFINLFQHVVNNHYSEAQKESTDALVGDKKILAYAYPINEETYKLVSELYKNKQLKLDEKVRLAQLNALNDVMKYWHWVLRLLETMKENKVIEISEYETAKRLNISKLNLTKNFRKIFQWEIK